MVDHIEIMVAAVIIAAAVMVFTATPLGNFVERHPTVKMLALSFLLLIGFTLIVEGLHQHIPKGYIYFAMGFSVLVEMLNLRIRGSQPVTLHGPHREAVTGSVATAVANVPVKAQEKKKSGKKRK
jgi:predicted tellurium resistance membrane protein TerC